MWPGFLLAAKYRTIGVHPTQPPMKQKSLLAATVGGTPDEIEQAFYEALHHGDIDQLMACWAEEDDIVCVLPGGMRQVGAGAIRSAYAALLAKGGVKAQPEQMHKIDALASAVHHMLERVRVQTPQGEQVTWITATHVYHKTAQGWRMVARHASAGAVQDGADRPDQATVLH